MSEPLFRFTLTRPPAQSDLKAPSVNLTQDSAFQGALRQAAKSQNPSVKLAKSDSKVVASN
jgi:hypothetical protein